MSLSEEPRGVALPSGRVGVCGLRRGRKGMRAEGTMEAGHAARGHELKLDAIDIGLSLQTESTLRRVGRLEPVEPLEPSRASRAWGVRHDGSSPHSQGSAPTSLSLINQD